MTGREAEAVRNVLSSGYINDGPVTREFERQIAGRCGRQFGVAVPNGTSAIALALMALGARPGDDVIVPDFTYIATANAVRLVGCNVVLADVDLSNFCISSAHVEAARTAKTKFLVAVEINGRLPDYDNDLEPYCFANNIEFITDSCGSLGSGGHWGAASCFSFSPNKLVTTGQGGMVVTNYQRVRDRLLELKQQGLKSRGDGGPALHTAAGYNFKFTDIQAAIGLEQLKELDIRLERLRKRNLRYRELLEMDGVEFPTTFGTLWTDVLISYPPIVNKWLTQRQIGCRRFWPPMHRHQPYRFDKDFPNATSISDRGIWLPSCFEMTEDEIVEVCNAVKSAVRLATA